VKFVEVARCTASALPPIAAPGRCAAAKGPCNSFPTLIPGPTPQVTATLRRAPRPCSRWSARTAASPAAHRLSRICTPSGQGTALSETRRAGLFGAPASQAGRGGGSLLSRSAAWRPQLGSWPACAASRDCQRPLGSRDTELLSAAPATLPLALPGPRGRHRADGGGRQTAAAAAPLDTEAEMREAAAAAREDAEPAAPAADPDAPVEMVRPSSAAARQSQRAAAPAGEPMPAREQEAAGSTLVGRLR
jgi:hypothetical protein